jgi:hypothetical protein
MYKYAGPRGVDNLLVFIKSGWLEKEGAAIPPPASWASEALFYINMVWEDLAMIYGMHPTACLAVGGGVAVFFVIVMALACRPLADHSPPKRPTKKPEGAKKVE